MRKRFLILTALMLLITMFLSVKVSAASITSATITVTPSKTEYKAGDTVEFTIGLKDLNASSGIMGLGAYIDYNTDLLTLNTKAEGLSGWTDATISENTHRFATTKDSHSENNESILKITFIAKNTVSNAEATLTLKKIEISNGAQYNIDEVSSNKITITPNTTSTETPPVESPSTSPVPGGNKNNTVQGETANPSESPSTQPSPSPSLQPSKQPETNTPSGNTNQNTGDEKLPQTGFNSYLPILIIIVTSVAVILFVRIKILNNKMNKGDL